MGDMGGEIGLEMEINYSDIVMDEELLLQGAGMTGWKMVRMKR